MGFQRILKKLVGKSRPKSKLPVPDLGKTQPPVKLPPLFFETLEQRLLLSATPFTFTANPLVAQDLTLSIVNLIGGPTVRLTDTGTGTILQQRLVADVSTISIALSNQADRISVASNFSAIGGAIFGNGGSDRIIGGASGSYLITGQNSGQALGLSFSAVEGLTGSTALADLFQLSTAGAMSAGIDGAGGADTVRLTGAVTTVSLQVNSGTTATLSVTGGVARTTNISNVEVVSDLTAPTTRTATGSALSEGITLSQSVSGVTARFNSALAYVFSQTGGSVTIDEGLGSGSIEVTSNLSLPNSTLTLRAEDISVGAFTVTTVGATSQGSIVLLAMGTAFAVGGTIDGLSASITTGVAAVTLKGSALTSGSIALFATTTLTSSVSASTLALAGASATATLVLTGASLTATTGTVSLLATTTISTTAAATAVAGTTNAAQDAAIAMGLARNATEIALDDTALVAATGITVRSRNTVDMSTTATGADGAGAVVAASFVEGTTAVLLSGQGSMTTGGTVDISAQEGSTVTTTATGGGAGAEANGGASQGEQVLAEGGGARTSEGALPVAAAVALARMDRVTEVVLADTQALLGKTGNRISSLSSDNLTTRADASNTSGNIAAAAAINLIASVDQVRFEGETIAEVGLVVQVGEQSRQTSRSSVTALSGSSAAKGLGLAGALALNDADADRAITLAAKSALSVGGSLIMAATGSSTDIANAASGAVKGAPVGIGASVALNFLDRDTAVGVQDTAALTVKDGAGTLQSLTTGVATTTAVAGAAGGTALTPAFALTQADGDNQIVIASGDVLTISDGMTLALQRTETITTEAKGTVQGTAASVGGAVALTVGLQDAVVAVRREVVTAFVAMTAEQRIDSTTRATASTSGGKGSSFGPMTADSQASAATGFASVESGMSVMAPLTDTPQGAMGLAAALALAVQRGSTLAVIDAGALVQVGGGAVTLTARSDVDATVLADGSVVVATPETAPDVGVGAAVALNLAGMVTLAELRGKVAGNLTLSAAVGASSDTSSAGISVLSTKAVAGAGAAEFGLAGAFALTRDDLDARATLGSGAATGGGVLSLLADSRSSATTTASADASLGAGGSGVGIGIGVAIGLLDSDAVAEVAGDAAVGASALAMTALTNHLAITTAGAGSAGGSVAAVPSVALTISQNDATVSLPAGDGLVLTGGAELVSNSSLLVTTEAKSAAGAATAAAGASLAWTSAEDQALTDVARNIAAAGAIALMSVQRGDIVTRAIASAAGVKSEGAGGPQTADDQTSDAKDFAAGQGSSGGGAGSAQSADGKFGLSAALALTFVTGDARSQVAAVALLQAGTDLSVAAEGDVDAVTLADASEVKGEGDQVKGVGIGAAVAITTLDRQIAALVDGAVTGVASVRIAAGMALDLKEDGRNIIETTAVAGVGAGDVAVTGAFAMTSGGVNALARIGASGSATAGDKGLLISAEVRNEIAATGSSDATLAGARSGVGIGAGVALILSDSTSVAQVTGDAETTGALTLRAVVDSVIRGKGAAGATNGAVAVAPSVLVVVDRSAARALVDAGGTVLVGGEAVIAATNRHVITGTAASAASGASAALGVTVAVVLDNGVAEAGLARKLVAAGDASLTAILHSDVVISAVASTKGVSQATSGAGSATADAQVSQQAGFAGSLGGTTGTAPPVNSSSGQFGLAASLALSVIGGGAVARLATTGVLQSDQGSVEVQALADSDSSVTADSSLVKGSASSDPRVGVGAAVALNLGERVTRALVKGEVSAAKSVTVKAGMAGDTDALNRSVLTARSVAGVGATAAAVSGAFAMNANGLTADASPAETARLVAGQGSVSILADNRTATTATGTANAALGQGGSGVGVGVGIALNLFTGSTLTEVPGAMVLVAGGGLVLAATADHVAGGAAAAGATGGTVGVAPSVLLVIDRSTTSASLLAGAALSLGGAVSVGAVSVITVGGTARSAGAGATAGLGVSVALSVMDGTTTAVVDRAVTATGNISVTANQRNDVQISAVASTSGVSTTTSGAASPEADSQIARETDFATTMGGPAGITAPSAASSGGKFGLAAAIGLSIVGGTVEARLDSNGSLTSTGGNVIVAALQDVDSAVTADGSTVTGNGQQQQQDIGVGAAVAINAINRTALARVDGDVAGATGITVNAGMAPDPLEADRSIMLAKAVSGVGARNVGVSGSFALNQINLDATPVIGAGRTLTAGGAGTKLLATVNTQATATASAAANLGAGGSGATGVGVGGAVAINLLDSDSLIAPPATAVFQGAGLVLEARGDHIAAGQAQAGATGGDVTVAPSVYIVAATNTAQAELDGGAGLTLTGDLALLASEKTAVSGTANSAATAGTAAIGVTLSLAVMENSATARLARDVATSGAVTLAAIRADKVSLTATASAAGVTEAASGGDTTADQQVGRELGFANGIGGTSGAVGSLTATDSSGAPTKVGIAAALALSVMTGDSRAEVALGTTVGAAGLVTVGAQADSDSSATADAKTVNTSVGIGAAVAVNAINQDNTALVAGEVTSNGLIIRASGLAGDRAPVNSFVARAVSGAGATNVGISGAFALNSEAFTTKALLTGKADQGLTGDSTITALVATDSKANASAKAINDETGTTSGSSSVGIGLSFGLNLVDNDVTAGLADVAQLLGGRDVTIAATGTHASTTKAAAGSGGAVGISPSLALLVSGNEARAVLGSGTALDIAGDFSAKAQQSHLAVLDTDASAKGDRVAVGAAVALAILPELATASPARSVTAAGDITFSSDLVTGVTSGALASTRGVAGSGGGPTTADGQSANLVSFANGAGGSSATAPNAAQVGGSGGSQAVGVAAALALNIVTGQAVTVLDGPLSLAAGGSVALLSRLDLDAAAVGDGSSAQGKAGVGVGVAINVVTGLNTAQIAGTVEAGDDITVTAQMSGFGDGVDTLTAKANAGVAGSNVGVAGSFALNISAIRSLAQVTGEARGTGVVTLQAAARSIAVAEAMSEVTDRASGGKGGAVGVGAAVAINILNDDETAEVTAGVPLEAKGGLVIEAEGDHSGRALAKAGSAGDIAVAPAVALNIVTGQTVAQLAAGDAVVVSEGLVEMSAVHRGIYAATADAAAGGKNVGVGAAVALNIIVESASALIARNVAAVGALTLRAQNQISGTTLAKGSASGNSSSAPDADAQADQSVNNNAAITSRAGPLDVGAAQDGVDTGAAESSAAAGGREPGGVGVGAAVAFNTIVTSSKAALVDGVTLAAGGDLGVLSSQEVDAAAEALGTAMTVTKTTNVGAAVALNVVTADNLALVGVDARLLGDGSVRVRALDLVTDKGSQTNDLTTRALAGAGADKVAVAASLAVTVAQFNTRAELSDGAQALAKGTMLRMQAQASFTTQSVAGGGTFGLGTGVGAAAVVNVFTARTEALMAGASLDAAGALIVTASTSYVPKAAEIIPGIGVNVSSVAGGGAVGLGDASIGGSVVVDVLNVTTRAEIVDDVAVNQAGVVPLAAQSVNVAAATVMTTYAAAGGVGAALGSAGIGAGVAVGVINDTTLARIGSGVAVKALGAVSVLAAAAVTRTGAAASAGLAGTAGIGGSVLVDVYTSSTRALVGGGAVVDAGGLVTIAASDNDRMTGFAGAAAVGGTAGVGVGLLTIIHTDLTEALLGDGARVTTHGGLAIRALSNETLTATAVAGAGGATAGVAASPAVSVLTETTRARIGSGAEVTGIGDTAAIPDIVVVAADVTKSTKVAGTVAIGGTAGVGAGLDVATLTKETEASLGASSRVITDGSLDIRAGSREDVTSLVMTGAGGGSAAVTGSVSVITHDITTRAFIEGTETTVGRTLVDAANNVIVQAQEAAEYDIFAGALGFSFTGSVGASASVPVVTKLTEAFIGRNADVTGRAQGAAGLSLDGGFDEALRQLDKGEAEVVVAGIGPGDLPIGQSGQQGGQPLEDTNGDPVDPGYDGNADAELVLTLTASGLDVRGVAVVAVNSDDLGQVAITGGGSGAVAVSLSGDVSLFDLHTSARIEEFARINQATGAHGASQDVVVLASSYFSGLTVAGAAAVAGTAAVSPSVAVVVLTQRTEALIGGGATVKAQDSVAVTARAETEYTAVVAGVAVAGVAAVGGSVGVLQLTSGTRAHIGTVFDGSSDMAATVRAGRDVLVQAVDDTRVVTVQGQVTGGGTAAVGASVGVASLDKRTSARISAGSLVTAQANVAAGGEGLGLFPVDGRFDDGKQVSGLSVLAGASEKIEALAFTGAIGPAGAGVAGAVSIALIDSDVLARIGIGARINQGALGGLGQDVRVMAENDVQGLGGSGGLGAGAAGIAGAFTIGVVRNAVQADIADGTTILAGGSVKVAARSHQDITSFAASVGLGGGAAALSFGIWVIGGAFGAGGGAASETDWAGTYQGQADGGMVSGGYSSVLGASKPFTFGGAAVNTAANTIFLAGHGLRTGDAVIYRSNGAVIGGLVDGQTYYVIAGSLTPNTIRLASTAAGASAGAAVDLTASSGGGATLAMVDTARSDTAISQSIGAVQAGGPQISLAAALDDDPASQGTLAQLGQVVIVNAAGGLRIVAEDNLAFTQVTGNVAVGGVAVGASFSTLVHHQPVTARVGDGSEVTLSGFGLDLQALSDEAITQIAVGAAVGSAGDVSGSATINVLTEETRASLGEAVQVQTIRLPGGKLRPDVQIIAQDSTAVSDVAGAASFSAGAGIGVGLDVVSLDKTTTATVGVEGLITSDGSVILRAHASEDMGSLSVTGAGAAGVAIAGSASVLVLDLTTLATIAGSQLAETGTQITAEGNVLVEAVDDTTIDIFAGAFTVGLAAALGGGAAVPVVTRVARAEIGDNATVTGRGLQGTDIIRTGTYSDSFAAAGTGDVVSEDIGGDSSGFGKQTPGGAPVGDDGRNTDYDDSYQGTAGAGQVHAYVADLTNGTGVLVSATSSDDISTLGVSGGISGTLAVNFSGVVSSLTGQTVARIGDASINPEDGGGAGAGQDIKVMAGSALTGLSVAVAIAGGGVGGVAPSAAVSFVGLTTTAVIDAGAQVRAVDGVQVNAYAGQVISVVGAGGAVAGVFGFGATSGVVSLTSATTALIGAGAVVLTEGSVRVGASDDTQVMGIVGALGGAGIAGAGASAQVVVITKDTLALIDEEAQVEALGHADQSAVVNALDRLDTEAGGLASVDILRGVVVEARSSEDLTLLSIAAGVGLAFGFGGAVGVAVVDSDTSALIGSGATVVAGNATARANVRVVAGNEFSAFMHTGAGALGTAGLAGALSVGILRNGVLAGVASGADVNAAGNIAVRSLSSRDIRGFTVAAGGGIAAAAGSVSVWNLGGAFNSAYSYDETDVGGSDPDNQTLSNSTRSEDQLAGSDWQTDQDDLLQGSTEKNGTGWEDILNGRSLGSGGSSSRADFIVSRGHGAVQADGSDGSVSGSLTNTGGDIEGTTARVVNAATISAGLDLEVRAEDVTLFDGVAGGVVLGVAAFGASISLLNSNMAVNASVLGSAGAGGSLDVIAKSTAVTGNYAIMGAGGLIVLGAQVAVTNDGSTRLAEVAAGTLRAAEASSVQAIRTADHQAQALGVTAVSAVSGGVSVGMVKLGGSTTALSSRTVWSDIANPGGNLVTISARTDTDLDVQAWGVGVGLIGAANGAVAWGEDSSTVTATASGAQDMSGGIDVIAAAQSRVDAKGVAGTVGGFVTLSAGVAVAKLRPTVTATAALSGTIGAARALAAFNADPENGAEIAGLGAHAVAWSFGAALIGVAAAGAIAVTDVRPVVSASNSSTASDREARAYGSLTAQSDAQGFAGGLVGFGAGVSFATVAGSITATVSGTARGAVVVDSLGHLAADANTQAVSGGLLALSANLAYATVSSVLSSSLTGTIAAGGPGSIVVTSRADGHANAATRGTSIGLIAGTGPAFLGGSDAVASYGPTVLASSKAVISGATSVTVRAVANGAANATTGGSGNDDPTAGDITIGLLALFGGFADARQSARATAELGNRVTASGIIRVESTATTEAQTSTTDLGLGLLTFGISFSHATNTAQSTTNILTGAVVTGGQIVLASTGAHYAKAAGNSAAGGLVGGATAVDVTNSMNTTALTSVAAGARMTASGQFQAITRNASEGDGAANATAGGILFAGGATSGIMNLTTSSQSTVGAGARITGRSVTIQAFGGTQPAPVTTNFNYVQNGTDVANDVIRITNHGLVTGQSVQLGTTASGTWADPDRIYTVLNAGDPNSFRLGAAFDAAGVNAARDEIVFADTHGFQTGDRVIYAAGGSASIINGVAPATLFVLVLDDRTIKLLDYNPASGLRGVEFDGGDVTAGNDQIAISGHGLTTGQIVTYHLPRTVSFNAGAVDLNAAQTAVDTGRNTIVLPDHQFQTGDRVTYSIRLNGVAGTGTTLPGLTPGTQYFVIRVDDTTVRLATTNANALAGTAIATLGQGGGSASARGTEHVLTPQAGAIGGLVDGKSYKVQVINANVIKLQEVATGAVVNLLASAIGGSSALVREGIDLLTRSGPQSLFIDMTSAISGVLQGPGGQSFGDTVLSQGDGRSRLVVDGFAIGLGGFSANNADINVSSTVRVSINAGTTEQPTVVQAMVGNVLLQSENRFDAVVDATAGTGGLFAAGSSSSSADFNVVTETRIGSPGAVGANNTRVLATGDVTATAAQITRGGANAFSSGIAGLSFADANSFARSTHLTSVLVANGATVQGTNVSLAASTAQTLGTVMGVNSNGAGASANAGEASGSGTRVLAGSETVVRFAAGANVLAANALSAVAAINGSRATSNATTHSIAAGGDSDAVARVGVSEVNRVVLDGLSRLQGLGSVTLAARVNDQVIAARSDANMAALGGDTDSTAQATGNVANSILGTLTALVRTPSLVVDVARDVGRPGLVVTADAPRSGAVVDFGSDSATPTNNLTNIITFNANVDLLRRVGSNVSLVINAAGVVTTATNATVEGGNGAGFDADGDGQIVVDNIGLDADGDALFRANAGGVVTGAGGLWTVFKGPANVTITNLSAAKLVLKNIDTAFGTLGTAVGDVDVDIQVGNASGLKFDIVTTYDTTPGTTGEDQRVIVTSLGSVAVAGLINNPLGQVAITSTGGSILKGSKSGQVITKGLTLNAAVDIGDAATGGVGQGKFAVVFVKAGARTPTASIIAGGNVFLTGFAAQRDLTATAPTVTITNLTAGGAVDMVLTDTEMQTILPPGHVGGIVVNAVASAINNAAAGGGGPISTAQFYREFYYPNTVGGTLSPDVLGVFGMASGARANATWNFQDVTVGGTQSIVAAPAGGGTVVTINLPALRLAQSTAIEVPEPQATMHFVDLGGEVPGAVAAKSDLDQDWTSETAWRGVIDWSGAAA